MVRSKDKPGERNAGWRVLCTASCLAAGLAAALATLPLVAWSAPQQDHERALALYQRGDVAGAMAALRVPAQAGHAAAQSLLAHILDHADLTEQAIPWWQAAAAQGDAQAHVGLANLHLAGRGLAKDEKRAVQHFSEAAALGHAAAARWLADAWLAGQMGLSAKDQPEIALNVWTRAAEQGHEPSAEALSAVYREGRLGVTADAAKAAAWQARALTLRRQRETAPAAAPAASRP